MNLRFTSIVATVVLLIIQFGAAVVLAEDLKLMIKSSSIGVADELIRIGDVARTVNGGGANAKTVMQLDLDEFVRDQPIQISKKQIEMRIRLSSIKFDNIEIKGPEVFSVRRVSIDQQRNRIKTLVKKAIVDQFGIDSEDVRLAVQPVNYDAATLGQENLAGAMVVLPAELPLGKTKVDLVYNDSSGNEFRLPLNCRISVVTDMLVATKNLDRGIELTASDYKKVRRPVSDRRLVPASVADLKGKQTSTVIPNHGVIQLASLRSVGKRNLVARNDVVDVIYSQGAIKLRIKNARVLTPGGIGDRVEFENPQSQKPLVASVVSESLLEVR